MHEIVDAAGEAVVEAMGAPNPVWQRTRGAVVDLWVRVYPDQADAVDADLEQSRTRTLTARHSEDPAAEQAEVRHWRLRLLALAEHDPEVLTQLPGLLAAEVPRETPTPHTATEPPVSLRAKATGRARVYQSGRDMHVTER